MGRIEIPLSVWGISDRDKRLKAYIKWKKENALPITGKEML